MRAFMQQFERAQRAFSAAYLGGIRFWMWLIDSS